MTWIQAPSAFILEFSEESLFVLADIASKWLIQAPTWSLSTSVRFPSASVHRRNSYLSALRKASICPNRRKNLNLQLDAMNPGEQNGEGYQFFRSKQSNWVPLSWIKAEFKVFEISLNGAWQSAKSPTTKKASTATLVKIFEVRGGKFVKKRVFFHSLDLFGFDL